MWQISFAHLLTLMMTNRSGERSFSKLKMVE